MASTTRVSAAAERRRAGNLLQASVADGMGFSDHTTIAAHRSGRNSPARVRIGSPLFTAYPLRVYVAVLMWARLVLRRPALLGSVSVCWR